MAQEKFRILLVEDEKPIRDAVTAYLEREEKYSVVGVGDGQSAVEEFEKHQFDLVILDLMLPKLTGERVCRAIRDTSEVPIIMLTAKGEVDDSIIGLQLGADDYLVKPFSPRELVARVGALLRRARQDSEPQLEVLDFGDYPATQGVVNKFVTFATIKDGTSGIPSSVLVRIFSLS